MSSQYKFWYAAAMANKAAGNHEAAARMLAMAMCYASSY